MKKLICILSLTLSSMSFAGPSTSGGGIGVLCKSATQQKLMLLDLFEASVAGQKLISASGSFENDYAVSLTNLRRLGGDSRPVDQADLAQLNEMLNKYSEFVNYSLVPTNDAGNTVQLPTNCHYEQIAVYQDSDNRLLINRVLWNQLDSVGQAALIMHEAIFRMQRGAFYVDSAQTRKLVSELFLLGGPKIKGAYDGLTKGKGLLCFAGDSGSNNSISFVWQGHEVHLLTFAGESRYVRTTLKTLVSVDDIKLQRVVIDNIEPAYRIDSTPFNFNLSGKYFGSELPLNHISWNQSVAAGEIFTVGMNVRGRTINLPVTNCFKY